MTFAQLSLLPAEPGGAVWVLDASAVIGFKLRLPGAVQWSAFQRLEDFVRAGQIAMPRQAIREVSEVSHPDVPGAWVAAMREHFRHPMDVDYQHIETVMRTVPQVVDPESRDDVADPYVVALALQLRAMGFQASVVTDDVIDRLPLRIALASACKMLDVPWLGGEAFLVAVGILA